MGKKGVNRLKEVEIWDGISLEPSELELIGERAVLVDAAKQTPVLMSDRSGVQKLYCYGDIAAELADRMPHRPEIALISSGSRATVDDLGGWFLYSWSNNKAWHAAMQAVERQVSFHNLRWLIDNAQDHHRVVDFQSGVAFWYMSLASVCIRSSDPKLRRSGAKLYRMYDELGTLPRQS
ncbi:MAG: hypothetical protein WBP22_01555 [Candidatus Saccharimonas sp.]